MNISPFLSTDCPCGHALPKVNQQLKDAGLRTVQTFDLHSAMSGMHGCSCPNHGTEECDCQMVVLLVYGGAMEPETLILHGDSHRTWISLADTVLQNRDPQLQITIQKALGWQKAEFGQ
jgi:hypothetical protein